MSTTCSTRPAANSFSRQSQRKHAHIDIRAVLINLKTIRSPRDLLRPPMPNLKSSEAQLEALARDMVMAINTQTLDPESAPWDSAAPDFTAEVAWTTTPQKTNLLEYLAALRKVRIATPKGRLHIVDITATAARGNGNVFVNQEWHNAPPGVVRPCIAIYDFIYTGSEWKCTRYRCLPGINPRAGIGSMLGLT